jgi:hypothetical protein
VRIGAVVTTILLASGLHAQILPNFGGQRAGLSSLTFLKNETNPIALGMAGSGTALAASPFSGSTNPGALAHLNESSLAVSNTLMGNGVHQSYFAYNHKLIGESVITGHINSMNSGWMKERTEFQPNGTGRQFSVSSTELGVSFSSKLTDFFSFGVQASYVNEIIADFVNHSAVVDVGFLYTTDLKDLQFAAVIQHFGGNSSISGSDIPVEYNRNEVDVNEYTAPTVFKLGFSMVPYEDEKHQLLVSGEINHPNDNAENIRLGVEWTMAKILKVRTGYQIAVKGRNLPSAGLSYKYHFGTKPFWIHYAFVPSNWMGNWHQVGVSLAFKKMEER